MGTVTNINLLVRMLLKREKEEDLVLYDDHGEAWRISFASDINRAAAGDRDAAGATGARAIEFRGSDGEPLRVLYDGDATREEELRFDEVVVHFLKAQD